jgi:endo-1,4-beta-mannosidase
MYQKEEGENNSTSTLTPLDVNFRILEDYAENLLDFNAAKEFTRSTGEVSKNNFENLK